MALGRWRRRALGLEVMWDRDGGGGEIVILGGGDDFNLHFREF
jgi:hypothetical protein